MRVSDLKGLNPVVTVNPIQTGGGGLLRPYQTLKLNNFKVVKAMTTKFSDFS